MISQLCHIAAWSVKNIHFQYFAYLERSTLTLKCCCHPKLEEAISVLHTLSFIIIINSNARLTIPACFLVHQPVLLLMLKNLKMTTTTPGCQACYRLISALNNVAHVRGNCQATVADHPQGTWRLYKKTRHVPQWEANWILPAGGQKA